MGKKQSKLNLNAYLNVNLNVHLNVKNPSARDRVLMLEVHSHIRSYTHSDLQKPTYLRTIWGVIIMEEGDQYLPHREIL